VADDTRTQVELTLGILTVSSDLPDPLADVARLQITGHADITPASIAAGDSTGDCLRAK
jgi:hypothetical protein